MEKIALVILYMYSSNGHGGPVIDHYQTLEECEAAKSAYFEQMKDWHTGKLDVDYSFCKPVYESDVLKYKK